MTPHRKEQKGTISGANLSAFKTKPADGESINALLSNMIGRKYSEGQTSAGASLWFLKIWTFHSG